MRIDLASFLTEQIERYRISTNAAPVSMPVRIISAPAHAEVPWCSPILLEIAANPSMRESWTKGHTGLQVLAEDLVNSIQQDSWASSRFVFSASPRGHINIKPLAAVKQEFINELGQGASPHFYSSKTILYHADLKQYSGQNLEPVNFVEDLRQLLQITANTRTNDTQRLLQHVQSKDSILVDDLLMLIFLQADAELDVEPYIKGIKGKEHKPWYILRTLSDLNRAMAMHIDLNSKTNNLLEVLTDSRHNFFKESAFECLVGIAGCITDLADEFYRFYNDPQVRLAPVAKNNQSNDLQIVQIINQVISEGYSLIKTSCELAQEVLKKEGLLKIS